MIIDADDDMVEIDTTEEMVEEFLINHEEIEKELLINDLDDPEFFYQKYAGQ